MKTRLYIFFVLLAASGFQMFPAAGLDTDTDAGERLAVHYMDGGDHDTQPVRHADSRFPLRGRHVCAHAHEMAHSRCCERLSEEREDPSPAAAGDCNGLMDCCLISGRESFPSVGILDVSVKPEQRTVACRVPRLIISDASLRPLSGRSDFPSPLSSPPARLANCTLLL